MQRTDVKDDSINFFIASKLKEIRVLSTDSCYFEMRSIRLEHGVNWKLMWNLNSRWTVFAKNPFELEDINGNFKCSAEIWKKSVYIETKYCPFNRLYQLN